MIFIPQYYEIICVKQYTNGSRTLSKGLSKLTYEECQEIMTELFDHTPHRIIEVKGIGKVCVEGFSVNKAYLMPPYCSEIEEIWYSIRRMK